MKNSLLLLVLIVLVGCVAISEPPAKLETPGVITNAVLPGVSPNPIPAVNQPPLPPGAEKALLRQSVAAPRLRAMALTDPALTNTVGFATITKVSDGYQIEFRNWNGPYWISSSDDGWTWQNLGQADAGTNGLTVIRVVDKENAKMRFYRLHF
jgi:hypothetical protein